MIDGSSTKQPALESTSPSRLASAANAIAADARAIAALEPLIEEQPFRDRPRGLLMRALAGAQSQELGLAQLCVAPAVLGSGGSIDERGAALLAGARRRPSTDVATPFLLAFAWLAIEEGDDGRAEELAALSELYDSSTHIGLTYVLARLEDWNEATCNRRRDRAVGRYLSADHHRLAKDGSALLADEVERWERRLQGRVPSGDD